MPVKITQAEIDSTIERSNQWTRHREAMGIIREAIRTPSAARRLGDLLTQEQLELLMLTPKDPHVSCTQEAATKSEPC